MYSKSDNWFACFLEQLMRSTSGFELSVSSLLFIHLLPLLSCVGASDPSPPFVNFVPSSTARSHTQPLKILLFFSLNLLKDFPEFNLPVKFR